MVNKTMELHKVIDMLDDTQIETLYKVATNFIAKKDFDYISPEDRIIIERTYEQYKRGEFISFASAEEMAAYFGVELNGED